jgi:DNA-binding NarL/FixJ family response regulator
MISIFIADNELLYLEALQRIFASIPRIKVVGQAGNGQEALRQIQLHRPDVVLLNVDMPDMNGFEIVRSIRHSHIPSIVIMISDQTNPYCRAASIEAGADFFLDKFFESQKIGPIVETLLQMFGDKSEVLLN